MKVKRKEEGRNICTQMGHRGGGGDDGGGEEEEGIYGGRREKGRRSW